MPAATITINEKDVVMLISEFLQNRELNISMLSLERETGVINGRFSDDMLFLRQLILDGQWDDVIEFIQPLETIEGFDSKKVQYLIMKYKYLELLCIKSEPNVLQNYDFTVDEVVKTLNSLENLCPTKEDYSNLCLLLTLPKLSDHSDYRDWNPSNARVECFRSAYLLVEKFMPLDRNDNKSTMSQNDRLLQLLLKGLLFESCIEFCQQQATREGSGEIEVKDVSLLQDSGFSNADLSLLSWLQSVPADVFSIPFEQKHLDLDIGPLMKPSLEASWSEQILVTPIKPKMFPHSAVPSLRPRSADIMSRSLNPQFDGLSSGLWQGRNDMTASLNARNLLSQSVLPGVITGIMSQSMRKPNNVMEMSMHKLFEENDKINTEAAIGEKIKRGVVEQPSQPVPRPSQIPNVTASVVEPQRSSTPPRTSTSFHNKTPAGSIRIQQSQPFQPARSQSPTRSVSMDNRASVERNVEQPASVNASVRDSSSELFKEYQKQRQLLQDKLAEQEKQREHFTKELKELEKKEYNLEDNKFRESSPSPRRDSIGYKQSDMKFSDRRISQDIMTSTPKEVLPHQTSSDSDASSDFGVVNQVEGADDNKETAISSPEMLPDSEENINTPVITSAAQHRLKLLEDEHCLTPIDDSRSNLNFLETPSFLAEDTATAKLYPESTALNVNPSIPVMALETKISSQNGSARSPEKSPGLVQCPTHDPNVTANLVRKGDKNKKNVKPATSAASPKPNNKAQGTSKPVYKSNSMKTIGRPPGSSKPLSRANSTKQKPGTTSHGVQQSNTEKNSQTLPRTKKKDANNVAKSPNRPNNINLAAGPGPRKTGKMVDAGNQQPKGTEHGIPAYDSLNEHTSILHGNIMEHDLGNQNKSRIPVWSGSTTLVMPVLDKLPELIQLSPSNTQLNKFSPSHGDRSNNVMLMHGQILKEKSAVFSTNKSEDMSNQHENENQNLNIVHGNKSKCTTPSSDDQSEIVSLVSGGKMKEQNQVFRSHTHTERVSPTPVVALKPAPGFRAVSGTYRMPVNVLKHEQPCPVMTGYQTMPGTPMPVYQPMPCTSMLYNQLTFGIPRYNNSIQHASIGHNNPPRYGTLWQNYIAEYKPVCHGIRNEQDASLHGI